MNERTKEIYDNMSMYEKVQFKKQQSEIIMIDQKRNEFTEMTDAERRKKLPSLSEYFRFGHR